MTALKETTLFIEELSEPKKSYARLGWIDISSSEWFVTGDGGTAIKEARLIHGKTLKAYAKSEIARLEKLTQE